jgi:hypothetical protein
MLNSESLKLVAQGIALQRLSCNYRQPHLENSIQTQLPKEFWVSSILRIVTISHHRAIYERVSNLDGTLIR